MNNISQIWREIDRETATLKREFELHRQALQYQIGELNSKTGALSERIKVLEAGAKTGLGSQMLGFLLSPTFQKFAIGSGSGVGAWILSRLMG